MMGKLLEGHPKLLKMIKVMKYRAPKTTFQPDKSRAENFHLEMAKPEINRPMAFEMVPMPPATAELVEPFILY